MIPLSRRLALLLSFLPLLLASPVMAVEGDNPFVPGLPYQPPFPQGLRIIIADPVDGAVLQESPQRVTVSFRRLEFDLVPSSLELWIDGVEYTDSLHFWVDQAWVDLSPQQLQRLRPYRTEDIFHDITASIRDAQNQIYLALARFFILPVCPGGCPWPFAPTDQPHVVSNLMEDWQSFGSPYFHSGIDIRKPAGTLVGACAAGTVVKVDNYSKSGTDPLYWEVAVRDAAGFIWQYHHLDPCCIFVSEGASVISGQLLGKVIAWSDSMNGYRYDHLHLNVVRWVGAGPVSGPYVDGFVHYNPLRFLTRGSYTDTSPPLKFDIYYTDNESKYAFAAASDPSIPLLEKDVDIVARLQDDMTEIPPPNGQPYVLGIYDLAYEVQALETECGMGYVPKTRLARFDEMPGGSIVRTQDSLLKAVYRKDLERGLLVSGTYYGYEAQRYFYAMTNTKAGFLDGPGGFWDTDRTGVLGGFYPDGRYRLKTYAKDFYGNETVSVDSVYLYNHLGYSGICPRWIHDLATYTSFHLKTSTGEDHAYLPPPVPVTFGAVANGSAIATVGSETWPVWTFDLPERGIRVALGLLQGQSAQIEYVPLLGDVILTWTADVQVTPLAGPGARAAALDPSRTASNSVSLRMSTRLAREPSSGNALIGTPAAYQQTGFGLVMARVIDVNGEPMTLLSEDAGGEDCAWVMSTSDVPPPAPRV
ncbi:MAG: M23 family metallopeptidase [Candidatus Eisenbacteria bacterium]|nr:M23 family metallopeptidase [Candidatus Eisenbacteria bacterium]